MLIVADRDVTGGHAGSNRLTAAMHAKRGFRQLRDNCVRPKRFRYIDHCEIAELFSERPNVEDRAHPGAADQVVDACVLAKVRLGAVGGPSGLRGGGRSGLRVRG